MKCLFCNTVFETDNPRKQFCSGKCKVAHHRKNVKKGEVTKFDLKVLYNEILALAQNIGSEPPKVYDSPKVNTTIRDEPKQWEEPKDYNYYYNQIKNLEGQEECTDFIFSVKADQNLAGWQKKMLEDRLRAKWQ